MQGEIDEHVVLDYAIFHISPAQNSYEALVCSKGKTEKLTTGPLDQLKLHLRDVSSPSNNSFKLQVAESLKGSSWFTKFTLAIFLHVVNLPEVIKVASTIENEISQLEETRRFQLVPNAKGHLNHSGDGTSDCMKEVGVVGLPQKIKVKTSSSDATIARNDAMDLRLVALKEELGASFNRAASTTCSTRQISDLAEFAQHFGAIDLRNCLLKYIALISEDQPSNLSIEHSTSSHGLSPAKIAQAERENSTESESSSESSDEGQSNGERSRPVRRSSPHRMSGSPMRGIQLGRSGSRRSSSLAIKSLNYFPSRERTSCNRDVQGTNSGDEESEPKKPENPVRVMSVQDAINLFERKQNDQNLDVQKRKSSTEVSVSTNKSVLRRWSAGTGDSFTDCSHENSHLGAEENELTEVKAESDFLAVSPNPVESAMVSASSEMERITLPPSDTHPELVIPEVEKIYDRATTSAEWNSQKEAELNQMLMKMMESKPGSFRGANAGNGGYHDMSSEQRGGFSSEQRGGLYSQYNEKRDEKLRAENARTRAAKEAQFKVMQETLKQSKAPMVSKIGGVKGKQDPINYSQRPRRNSSPPVLARKEVSKPTGSRKASPRPSPLPGTKNLLSSSPLPRTTTTPSAKPSPGTVSTNSTPNCRKPKPTLSPTKPGAEIERSVQQPKGKKGTRVYAKPSLKGQEEKQQKAATKTSRSTKAKSSTAAGDDSNIKSAKPSFYSKVTRRSSVVPLESKPFLRKGTGISPVMSKTKVSQSGDSPKSSGNLIQGEETRSAAVIVESATLVPEHDLVQTKGDVDANLEAQFPVQETTENSDRGLAEVDNDFKSSVEPPVAEIQPDEDLGISSAAWVDEECREISTSCDDSPSGTATSPRLAPSTHVRHSLSQMLQADNSEPDTIDWGNAETPPALIYQKDAPKGLKRLLMFARKSKGEPNAAGWASSSIFSEGEDDPDESKAASKRSSDTLLRKDTIQAKAFGLQKTMFSDSFDGDSNPDILQVCLSAQSCAKGVTTLSSHKLLVGNISATSASTKATRSFFSRSAFRSSKSNEAKLR